MRIVIPPRQYPSEGMPIAIRKTEDGFTCLGPTQFHENFAAGPSVEQAAFMATSPSAVRLIHFQ